MLVNIHHLLNIHLYTSAFKIPSTTSGFMSSTGPLTFNSIQIQRTYCITSISGNVTAVQDDSIDTILVGNDWQSHKAARKAKGTYSEQPEM